MKIFQFLLKFSYSIIYYVFYVILWKETIKRLIRLISRKHEIERIAYKYLNYNGIRRCILNSRELSSIHNLFINQIEILKEEDIEKILNSIRRIKKISDQQFFKLFKRILDQNNKMNTNKLKLKEYYREKFDCENTEHTFILFDIWNRLKDNSDIKLVDRLWLEIGFQGQDPSTDLRGAGMLGLRNLHYFVKECKEANAVFKVATDPDTWYFFCASGINFTGKVIYLIESGKLDNFLSSNTTDILEFSNKLYSLLFTSFNSYWLKLKIKDFMKFNSTLEEFMNREAHKYYHRLN